MLLELHLEQFRQGSVEQPKMLCQLHSQPAACLKCKRAIQTSGDLHADTVTGRTAARSRHAGFFEKWSMQSIWTVTILHRVHLSHSRRQIRFEDSQTNLATSTKTPKCCAEQKRREDNRQAVKRCSTVRFGVGLVHLQLDQQKTPQLLPLLIEQK